MDTNAAEGAGPGPGPGSGARSRPGPLGELLSNRTAAVMLIVIIIRCTSSVGTHILVAYNQANSSMCELMECEQ